MFFKTFRYFFQNLKFIIVPWETAALTLQYDSAFKNGFAWWANYTPREKYPLQMGMPHICPQIKNGHWWA